MNFGKRRLLVAFLERDNVKLLAYEVAGKETSRIFGGQITFSTDVIKEAFIADAAKFSLQLKAALAQKAELGTITEAILFMPAEKSYMKSLSSGEAIEVFIRSLPYFKEELIIDPGADSRQRTADSGHPENGEKINHVAFEKKLVEDFERPFLDSGKKVEHLLSSIKVLLEANSQSGRYLVLTPFEKDVVIAAMNGGEILDVAAFARDVFVGRLNEFRLGKGFGDIKDVYTLGIFDPPSLDKIRTEQQLNVTELAKSDIYDLTVNTFLNGKGNQAAKSISVSVPKVNFGGFGGLSEKFAGKQKFVFLAGAAVVGFVLVIGVYRALSSGNLNGGKKTITQPLSEKTTTPTVTIAASPTPALVAADIKVRVLNGTTVAGEAGKAATAIKSLGFPIDSTGNATASGFLATRLRASKDVPTSLVDSIKSELMKTYQSVNVEELVDSGVKVEVIVGKKK